MFSSSIIVFRETLEAALIIGIITAATRGVPGRSHWVIAGIAAGLIGSTVVAAATGTIAEMASGLGQELFNAGVLGIAVLMLAAFLIFRIYRVLPFIHTSFYVNGIR